MATLATIRTNVLAKLSDGGGIVVAQPTAAQVTDQINSSIDFYSKRAFWFSEAVATGVLVTGVDTLAMPSDFGQFVEPDSFVIQQSNVRYPLKKVTPLQMDSMNNGGTGLPWYFCYRDGSFQMYYAPDQAYVYYLHYRKIYAALVLDADTNDFTTYAQRLIEYKTLADCYADYRSDAEMAAYYNNKVKEELLEVKRQTDERATTGMLTTEDITGYSGSHVLYN